MSDHYEQPRLQMRRDKEGRLYLSDPQGCCIAGQFEQTEHSAPCALPYVQVKLFRSDLDDRTHEKPRF